LKTFCHIFYATSGQTEEGINRTCSERNGSVATPDKIQFADALPKTRNGKIVRRILRKIAAGDVQDLGDLSTLADRAGIEKLVQERQA